MDENEQTQTEEQPGLWQEEEAKPKDEGAKVEVRLVRQQGQSALIEWQAERGSLLRGVIESIELDMHSDGRIASVKVSVLYNALPYGLNFLDLKLPDHDLIKLETELHKNDIWTDDDVLINRPQVMRALNSYSLSLLRALIDFAKHGGK